MQALTMPSLEWLQDLPTSFVMTAASPLGQDVAQEPGSRALKEEPLRLTAVCPLSGSQTKVLLFGWEIAARQFLYCQHLTGTYH
jgi:hypothetical protein